MNCGGLGNHVSTSLTMIAVLYRLLQGKIVFVGAACNCQSSVHPLHHMQEDMLSNVRKPTLADSNLQKLTETSSDDLLSY